MLFVFGSICDRTHYLKILPAKKFLINLEYLQFSVIWLVFGKTNYVFNGMQDQLTNKHKFLNLNKKRFLLNNKLKWVY